MAISCFINPYYCLIRSSEGLLFLPGSKRTASGPHFQLSISPSPCRGPGTDMRLPIKRIPQAVFVSGGQENP
jgi:hypothetical protein